MRFSTSSRAACILSVASLAFANSDVLKLNADNFESSINAHSLILVEFFAPWCGHCKALAPNYEEAASALKDKNIVLASVDCVDQADLCQSNNVQGYPTLKVYKNSEPKEYHGPRQAEGIISYMTKQSLPAVSIVTSENHEEFLKADKFVAIAYLPSSTAVPAPVFSSVAESHRDDYLFGLVTDDAVAEAAKVKPPALVVYRSFDEHRTEYPDPLASVTTQQLEDWFGELAIPVIDEVNGENYGLYTSSGKPLAYLFLDPSSETKDANIAAIKPIAKKYKSKVNFVWIDAAKFAEHGKQLNLEAKWPAFVIQDLEDQFKFPLDQSNELTADAVDHWVEQFLTGKLEPSLKSQPIPESQNESVYTVVGKSYEQVVLDDSKDVFIEFYASWCGHCKRLAPTWLSLGEKYAPLKDTLVIAKMESPENDLPPKTPFRVSGFPTLKFKPAGTREFIDYEGDRSLESLVAFVEAHAKNPLDLPEPSEIPVEAQVPLANDSPAETEKPKTENHDEL